MSAPKTKNVFIDGDYYAATTEDGGARIGLKDVSALQVPAGHALLEKIMGCKNEDDVEDLFDSQVESGLIHI